MNWDNTDDPVERRRRLVDVAARHAETVLTAIGECVPPAPGTLKLAGLLTGLQAELDRLVSRLKVHQPIAVDEHGQIHPAGDAIARLAAELQHVVTRYYWLTELPPTLIEDFAGDLTRLSEAAHRMRDAAGRPAW
jgi:hypothetical protein